MISAWTPSPQSRRAPVGARSPAADPGTMFAVSGLIWVACSERRSYSTQLLRVEDSAVEVFAIVEPVFMRTSNRVLSGNSPPKMKVPTRRRTANWLGGAQNPNDKCDAENALGRGANPREVVHILAAGNVRRDRTAWWGELGISNLDFGRQSQCSAVELPPLKGPLLLLHMGRVLQIAKKALETQRFFRSGEAGRKVFTDSRTRSGQNRGNLIKAVRYKGNLGGPGFCRRCDPAVSHHTVFLICSFGGGSVRRLGLFPTRRKAQESDYQRTQFKLQTTRLRAEIIRPRFAPGRVDLWSPRCEGTVSHRAGLCGHRGGRGKSRL